MDAFLIAIFAFLSGACLCHLLYRFHLDRALRSWNDPEQTPALRSIASIKTHAQKSIEAVQSETNEILERYDILTENLAASVMIRDANNTIAYCSPYTEVLTGYSLDEIYESESDFFYALVHEDDRERYERALRVITAGEPFQYRYRFFHKSGLEMWAETRTVPLLDKHDNLLSSLSITLDVTGTIRYQQQVEEKNQDLKDFTYMITHDLKSPIYTIKGMVNVIEEDCGPEVLEKAREPIDHIKTAITRLEVLVSSVLEYSEISSTEFELEDVAPQDVLQDLRNDFKHQLEVSNASLRIAGTFPHIYGNSLKLYQIFSNLIGNAIKYRSSDRPLQITIEPGESHEDRYLVIEVKDNGQGIAPEKIHNIFRPFQRAVSGKPGQLPEGSGIGLACVQKLLHKLGGDIEVLSEPDCGSTFILRLKKAGA